MTVGGGTLYPVSSISMDKKDIIAQAIATEQWLDGAKKEVAKLRKMLENVNSPASKRGVQEQAAQVVARNMTRKRKRA